MISIPTLMMLALVVSHTTAIAFLKKKRAALNLATADGQARDKQFKLIVTILYLELPLLTALIWLVVKPALMPGE